MQRRVPVTLTSYMCAGVTGRRVRRRPRFEYEVREQALGAARCAGCLRCPWPGNVGACGNALPAVRWATRRCARSPTRQAPPRPSARVPSGTPTWSRPAILVAPFADYEKDYAAVHEAIIAESAAHGLKVTTHVTALEQARTSDRAGRGQPAAPAAQRASRCRLSGTGEIEGDRSRVPTLAVWQRNFIDISQTGHGNCWTSNGECGDPQVIASWHEAGELPSPPKWPWTCTGQAQRWRPPTRGCCMRPAFRWQPVPTPATLACCTAHPCTTSLRLMGRSGRAHRPT